MLTQECGVGLDFAQEFLRSAKVFLNNQGTIIGSAKTVYAGDNAKEYISPVKAFKAALASLTEDEMIQDIQDMCCLYRLDTEMEGVGFCSGADFAERLPRLVPKTFDTGLLPKASNFKNIDFGSKSFPYWNWGTFGEKKVPHIKSLCTAYLRFMQSKGFVHPMLGENDD